MTEEQCGLLVIDIVGTEVAGYLDCATYHNFYWKFKDRLQAFSFINNSDQENNCDANSDRVNECIRFMKYNQTINYAQAIISIYCNTDDETITDWNRSEESINYYNVVLNNLSIAHFDNINIIDAFQVVDENIIEQERIKKDVLTLKHSPFDEDLSERPMNQKCCILPFYSKFSH